MRWGGHGWYSREISPTILLFILFLTPDPSDSLLMLLSHQKRNELMNLSTDKTGGIQKGRSKTDSTVENSKGKV